MTDPAANSAARNTRAIVTVAIAALLVIAGAIVTVVLVNRDEVVGPGVAATRVTLEPAADTGTDPFLAGADITDVPAFGVSVTAAVTRMRDTLPSDTSIGTRAAPGTTPELYGGRQDAAPGSFGGSGEQTVCDIEQLADILDGDPAIATAWAGIRGVEPAGVRQYLQTLTPVTLLWDTAVTNYGFAGGVATQRQSVLQAGTAALVDPTGLPVVRCACGNPLSAPTVTGLPNAEFLGTRWAGFDPTAALRVNSGTAVPAFTIVDLTGGAAFERTVGAAAAAPTEVPVAQPATAGQRTIVVVDSAQDATGVTGVVSASTDGLDWVTVLTTPGRLSGIGYGDGLTVIVGGDAASGGTVRSSQDGTLWTEPVAVPAELQKVAYGDGQWLAVGTEADPAGGAVAVTYTSSDARTWTKGPVATGIAAASSVQIGSVAYGQGRWQISYTARASDGRGFGEVGVVASTDNGQNWQPVVAPGTAPSGYGTTPVSLDLAFGTDRWGLVGYTLNDVTAGLGTLLGQSGVSADGTTWLIQPTQLTDTYLDSLAWAGDGEWLARGGLKGGMTGASTDLAVYLSSDLANWTRLGSPGGQLADIAATRWATLASADVAAPSTPAAADACTDGGLAFTVSREASFPTCEAMIAQWRSFMATGGTETRQRDWICRLPAPAAAGTCALSDTDIYFTVGAAGSDAGIPGAVAPGATEQVSGDLGLSVPMSRPACDGTGIVVLFSAVSPSTYAQEVQAALDANPGSSYLRTDQSCSSLNPASAEGNAIYAVFRVAGTDQGPVCAAVNAAGGIAYGKWLDNTTSPESRIDC